MEVHYHPAKHEHKKKIKEYLAEFTMIFLAVTLGFFAESFREHISDREREKEYIKSFIENIKTDTAELRDIVNEKHTLSGYDTLFKINRSHISELAVQDSIFFYSVKYLSSLNDFRQTDFTIIQLRNAGGYRLIKKPNVADSLAEYETKNDNLKLQSSFLLQSFVAKFNSFSQIFDLGATDKMFPNGLETTKLRTDLPVLISNDKDKMAFYINECYQTNLIYKSYLQMLKKHLEFLTNLLQFLKNTYDLG